MKDEYQNTAIMLHGVLLFGSFLLIACQLTDNKLPAPDPTSNALPALSLHSVRI